LDWHTRRARPPGHAQQEHHPLAHLVLLEQLVAEVLEQLEPFAVVAAEALLAMDRTYVVGCTFDRSPLGLRMPHLGRPAVDRPLIDLAGLVPRGDRLDRRRHDRTILTRARSREKLRGPMSFYPADLARIHDEGFGDFGRAAVCEALLRLPGSG